MSLMTAGIILAGLYLLYAFAILGSAVLPMTYKTRCHITWILYRKWMHVFSKYVYYPLYSFTRRNGYKLYLVFKKGGEVGYPLRVVPFQYNGFMGTSDPTGTVTYGKYLYQTNDPGIVAIEFQSGTIKFVPTYAILNDYALPKLSWENCFKEGTTSTLFGHPSSLTDVNKINQN